MIRVAIVDDHQVVRDGICAVCEGAEDIEVVGGFANGQQLVDGAAQLAPDVVVMDMGLPDGLGSAWAEAVRRILPDVKVLILTGFHSDDRIILAMDAGVDGFMYKESSAEDLLAAVREVARGGFHVSAEVARRMRDLTMTPGAGVTPREIEVLIALRDGRTTDEIAMRLLLSKNTVKTHLGSLYRKLDARNRVEAVREAIRRGIIGED